MVGFSVPRWAMAGLGVAGTIIAIAQAFEDEKHKGDPQEINRRADFLDALAANIDIRGEDLGDAARRVWNRNSGKGVDAFKDFVKSQMGGYIPNPSGSSLLSAYIRRDAVAHRKCAESIQKLNDAIDAIETSTIAVSIMFIFWGELTAWAGPASEAIVQALVSRNILLVRIMSKVSQQVMAKIIEYVLGSAFFASSKLAITDASDQKFGVPVESASESLISMRNDFLGAMVFYTLSDTKGILKPIFETLPTARSKAITNITAYMVGSIPFTTVDNLLSGQSLDKSFPSWNADLQKLILAMGQQGK